LSYPQPRTCRLVLAGCLSAALSAGLPGCGKSDELIPVTGKVLFKDQPLPKGTVVLTPDAAKGNPTLHEPRGEIDAQGNYTLNTSGKLGAPPGWYKVAVIAMKEEPRRGGGGPPIQWLAPPRYVDPNTSQLALEVKRNAAPESYDLRLKP
jgi:hypothetical protein